MAEGDKNNDTKDESPSNAGDIPQIPISDIAQMMKDRSQDRLPDFIKIEVDNTPTNTESTKKEE